LQHCTYILLEIVELMVSDHGSQSWKLPVSSTEFNYLEKDDIIRFKIEEESFKEATPAPPKSQGSGEVERREEHKDPIYSLIVICRSVSR
jgi:DNA-directed RNA polymerase subunit E'/Rpb7